MENRTYSARVWQLIAEKVEDETLRADLVPAIEDAPDWDTQLEIELDEQEMDEIDAIIAAEQLNTDA